RAGRAQGGGRARAGLLTVARQKHTDQAHGARRLHAAGEKPTAFGIRRGLAAFFVHSVLYASTRLAVWHVASVAPPWAMLGRSRLMVPGPRRQATSASSTPIKGVQDHVESAHGARHRLDQRHRTRYRRRTGRGE